VQLLKSGRHDDGDGKPVVLAEFGVAELSAHQCREGVVLALRVSAGVVVLGGLAGFTGDSGAGNPRDSMTEPMRKLPLSLTTVGGRLDDAAVAERA
jgi:hypothetical protein